MFKTRPRRRAESHERSAGRHHRGLTAVKHLFAYGPLMCEDILRDVAGCRLRTSAATLQGYARRGVRGETYPALVPEDGARVEGIVYRDVPDPAWARLDAFEGDMYERRQVRIHTDEGATLSAETYVVRPSFMDRLETTAWSFEGFLEGGKNRFLHGYEGFQALAQDSRDFYARLAPLYHLIYPDWEASMRRQAGMLDAVIRERWGEVKTVLDASCGIGTQAIGLAALGYRVTASDLSPEEVARARHEAEKRGHAIDFSVGDMRTVHARHPAPVDLVLSCDNSVPHLLTDRDILTAFRQFHRCTRPGGGCLISVRDYENEDLARTQVKPYGVREANGARWLIWQLWEPKPPCYKVTMRFGDVYMLEKGSLALEVPGPNDFERREAVIFPTAAGQVVIDYSEGPPSVSYVPIK